MPVNNLQFQSAWLWLFASNYIIKGNTQWLSIFFSLLSLLEAFSKLSNNTLSLQPISQQEDQSHCSTNKSQNRTNSEQRIIAFHREMTEMRLCRLGVDPIPALRPFPPTRLLAIRINHFCFSTCSNESIAVER